MRNTILISLLLMLLPVCVSAQFYTITRDSEILPTERQKEAYKHVEKDVTKRGKSKIMAKDTLIVRPDNQKNLEDNSRNSDRKTSLKTEQQKKTDDITKSGNNLPELTIPNLYKEIIRNGILYPKIVLAQAILETDGSVRQYAGTNTIFLDLPIHVQENTMNSIIGRKCTGVLYKVQYKYKGGNYLLWLDEIGYAEDSSYIITIIRLIKNVNNLLVL